MGEASSNLVPLSVKKEERKSDVSDAPTSSLKARFLLLLYLFVSVCICGVCGVGKRICGK